ncbi:hypothetical protein ASPZODRAFT_131223 [Penicilliopsis zonata CBS 506.65]|uniref:SnoaL-like domain-containing protein n=1 Tax=Penicilliopsis zonata CBS 506.65 TaxID=1073090 RepID=A0A1L9SKP4_9EURO|nr:hypothetical protein ASPZODRAFT_131223 [Penicilliopsis zonata CBS 506.65]OJJ47673.1 hypothetical protein ASPZODRAFT_131223 [Penicilliopsis zonata CBS 506.65]
MSIPYDPTLAPSTAPAITSFLASFYATSDNEALHEKYADSFTQDATLIMASKVATGSEEILSLRHGLWTHVFSRSHSVSRLYFGAQDSVMLYGKVVYTLKSDKEREIEVPWAARADFVLEPVVRMRFYQVYLGPSAQSGK